MYEYKVSICILTMDQWDLTKKCLDSLEKTSWDEKIELVIVDNGSKDETVENLLQYQKNNNKIFDYTVLINSSNRGCTGGRNQACRIAKGEYIVIIDNDVEIIESTWLKKLFEFYQQHDEKMGIVGPKMLYPNTDIIQQIGLGVTKEGRIGYWGQGKNRSDENYNKPRVLQGYPAACWLMKRSIFDECGYFDDIYYPVNLEDVDFCYRIRQKGYKIMYCPDVEMYHYEHGTTQNSEGIAFVRVTVKNGLIFKKRWSNVYEKEDYMPLEELHWEKKINAK